MSRMRRRAAGLAAIVFASLIASIATSACTAGDAPPGDAGPGGSGGTDGEIVRAVDEIITRELEAVPMAGVSVAISRGGDLLVAKGYGYADIENDVPATNETVYRIGSITKQFTAASIMQLIESGDVSLDDELTRFLPDYPMQGHVVTVEHLLNHTSGIKSYTGLGWEWRKTIPLDFSRDELVSMFQDEPFDFAPGERFLYNNSGYYLLGLIIEKAGGQTYTEYLEQHVFPKADLEATYYCDNQPIIPRRAEGYKVVGGEVVNDDLIGMRQPYAAGALCSTVIDLVKWTRALSRGAVVSTDSYAQMTSPRTLNDGSELDYGFGLGVGELDEHSRIAHVGGINGFRTMLTYYPDDDVIVTVLTNSGSAHPGQLADDLSRLALGLPTPEIADLDIAADDLASYAGAYGWPQRRIEVVARDDGLFLGGPLFLGAYGTETRLKNQGEHAFIAALDAHLRVRFVVEDDTVIAIDSPVGGRMPRMEEERQ